MYLKHLALTNFRNYTRLELDLQARIHLLQGENAQGKTNLLEAIYYLATTKSPLTDSDKELINWLTEEEPIPYAHVEGTYVRAGQEHTLEFSLVKERQPSVNSDEPRLRRQIRLDGALQRAMDVVGQLNTVLFLPADIALVAGAPGERRRYLDTTLCQLDPVYCRSLAQYNRVIAQRNALLRQIREGRAGPAELDYWDEQLIKAGAYVLTRRFWAVRELNKQVARIQPSLTGGRETLVLTYHDSVLGRSSDPKANGAKPMRTEMPSETPDEPYLADRLRRALHIVRREEVMRGISIVGPHRDDMRFLVNNVDMTPYGSRGQQRTTALALKLGEVALMREQTGEMPILLLDDVISELDSHRIAFLLQTVSQAQQVFITTTDLCLYPEPFVRVAICWRVSAGAVSPLE